MKYIVIIIAFTQQIIAAVLTVTSVKGDASSGTLSNAIALASAGDEIQFASNLSGTTIKLDSNQILIDKNITVNGSTLTNPITIQASPANRVFQIINGNTLFLNFVHLTGGELTNSDGGAILAENSSLHLTKCTFYDNAASKGGAISVTSVIGSSVTLTCNSCTFYHNTSTGNGGSINISTSNSGSSVNTLFDHSTFSKNRSLQAGGAIHMTTLNTSTSNASLLHCTITKNLASQGGGIARSQNNSTASIGMGNCIIANNCGDMGPDYYNSPQTLQTSLTGKNLFSSLDYSGLTNGPSVLKVHDTKLSPLGYFGGKTMTITPLVGSPAIDAITSMVTMGVDQRGFNRFVNGALDLGSVEVGPIYTVGTLSDNPNVSSSLRHKISQASSIEGSVIRFDPTIFTSLNKTITLTSGQLLIPQSTGGLIIDATNIDGGVSINGNGNTTNHRVLEIGANSSAALLGLNLINGKEINTNGGGAIYSKDSYLTLAYCSFLNNYAENAGGAIYIDGQEGFSKISLHHCSVTSNSCYWTGGGIFVTSKDSGKSFAVIENSTFHNNSSSTYGGGLFIEGSEGGKASYQLSQCTFSSNTANTYGGAMYVNSSYSGNIFMHLDSCTISENSSTYFGGGIYADGTDTVCHLIYNNNIISKNSSNEGPDIFHHNATSKLKGMKGTSINSIFQASKQVVA